MKAHLEILKLDIPLGLFKAYHDDGYVASMQEHMNKLTDKYRFADDLGTLAEQLSGNIVGVHKEFRTLFRVHHHIFYKDLGFEAANVATRAHEETHALMSMQKLHYLANVLAANLGVTVDFEPLYSEVKADVGSVYALLIRGLNLDEFEKGIEDKRYTESFQTARKLVERLAVAKGI